MHLLRLLGRPIYACISIGVAILLFDGAWYVMATLPGTRDEMCMIGANLTWENILFALFVSGALSLLLIGVIEILRANMRIRSMELTGAGVGGVLGIFTLFCTICTFPALSLFGLSVSLQFVTEYSWWFKLLSIVVLVLTYRRVNLHIALGGGCPVPIRSPRLPKRQ